MTNAGQRPSPPMYSVESQPTPESRQTQPAPGKAIRGRARHQATPHQHVVTRLRRRVSTISEIEPSSDAAPTDGTLALLDTRPYETPPSIRTVPARHRILVVEDDTRVANVIRDTLELEGDPDWAIDCASEGLHALELAGAVHPDIILLDVRLPGLDGAEVYRRLRASQKTRRSRVIFLSAGTSLDLYHRGIEDGVLLRKPFDVRELVDLVRTILVQ